jgi:ATP-dependent RNA helicase DeaD
MGFEQPTPIQEKIIPRVLGSDQDLIALAQTGTGKTAAFGLPLIQLTDMHSKDIQALILCPTRELCMQITSDMEKFSKYCDGYGVVPVYGGTDIRKQIKAVKHGCHIVVGTPGRIMDLQRRKAIDFSSIRWLILDEADEMLNMGFKEDLDIILAGTPEKKRTLLFSATMPSEITQIAKKYMKQPEEISVGKRNQGAEHVRHEYYVVHARDRYSALKRLVDINPGVYGIIFCRTRQITKEVADKLMADGYNADALHGDLSQVQRDYVMNKFRLKQLQLLVATDVAARGIDVSDLTHIINYDLPDDNEVYIHRTGRTGRAGKSGVAISIVHAREGRKVRDLEKITGKRFDLKKVPSGMEICEKQLYSFIDRVEKIDVDDSQISQFLPVISKKLDWLSREELIKHFISVEFNRFLSYYKDLPDLDYSPSDERPVRRVNTGSFSRFHVNLGNKHGLNASRLIGLINEQTRNRNILIGKIEITTKHTYFEVESAYRKEIENNFRNAVFEGIPVIVELAKPVYPPSFSPRHYSGGKKSHHWRKKGTR